MHYHGEVTGKVIKVIDENGTTKAGKKYHKIQIILKHDGAFDTVGVYQFWETRYIQIPTVTEGDEVEIKFIVQSNEVGNKWFNNVQIKELSITRSVDVEKGIDENEEKKREEYDNADLPF